MKCSLFLSAIPIACFFPATAAGKHPETYLRYELTEKSTFTEGCFPPCRCPLSEPAAVMGFVELRFLDEDPLFTRYQVSSLSWTASWPQGAGPEVFGCGTYTVGGELAIMHRLELDLIVDEELLHFDSGLVGGGGSFPEALDVTVSMNNRECFDRVFEVHALTAAADHVDFTCSVAGGEAIVQWHNERPETILRIDVLRDGELVARLDAGASEHREAAPPGKHVYAAFAGIGGGLPGGDPVDLFLGSCCVEGPPGTRFVRGDCDGNGDVTGQVTDALFLLQHNFLGGPEPPCLAACDANADGDVTGQVGDAVYLLLFNFLGGPPPPLPFPECGEGKDGKLGCQRATEGCG